MHTLGTVSYQLLMIRETRKHQQAAAESLSWRQNIIGEAVSQRRSEIPQAEKWTCSKRQREDNQPVHTNTSEMVPLAGNDAGSKSCHQDDWMIDGQGSNHMVAPV